MGLAYYEHHDVVFFKKGQRYTNGVIFGEIIDICDGVITLEFLFYALEMRYKIEDFAEEFKLIE